MGGRRFLVIDLTWTSGSPAESLELGRWLGKRVLPGDVLLLEGELGAGKTLLTKGLAAGLGIDPDRVTSPSFTLVQVHRGRIPLYHVDLYRLEDAAEIEALGLEELLEGDGVAAVEWASRLPGSLRPEGALWVWIEAGGEDRRRFRLQAAGDRMEALLEELAQVWAGRAGKEADEG
ncbi:tRNA (adenosine(37)-N6)-threonylcarbamoyltransferase complex ATPase subunit type 1 TsaE [Limnochorda pilosa]|uniref:tRNA threonylcarbamoyladenosine biosynthesis protein TsaE n=1 Tax=Limnochorda pilosa TaxID=1555112 RepID=A0A0K2SPD7_LIMPI|nr:tRNA (adenosine(37)-N6)-threonylcarbamoyltransferase complex ATPase subunit type 1 TsaE [Limnochorda pilosa]BAS28669.1 ATP-binding protein [Limnochorda pilosa]